MQGFQSLTAMKGCSGKLDSLPVPRILFEEIVRRALLEDLGEGDVTTRSCVSPDVSAQARIVAKEEGLLAGLFVAEEVFHQLDPGLVLTKKSREGGFFSPGDVLLTIEGRAWSILQGERVALNFLQRMCGIATLTRKYVNRIKGKDCRIVGTRKTTPGLRCLEKYAIRVGGGFNHRFCLSDGVLIKDNHISACGSIREAIERARANAPHTLRIEVEVTDEKELREAISAGADVIMLDNMSISNMIECVRITKNLAPHVIIEASGGVTLDNVAEISATGVDVISSGALTHSYKSIDLSLKLNIL